MRIRRALVPLLLVTASALSACGGGDDSDDDKTSDTSSDTSSDTASTETSQEDDADAPAGDGACGLLSTDEVAQAVGSPVKEGTHTSGPAVTGGSFDTCIWQSDDPDHPADTATVTIYPNADAADSVRSDDSEPIEGIGDEAFAESFASVWVYDGEQSFFAQWYTFSGTDEENLPKSKALATSVADAL